MSVPPWRQGWPALVVTTVSRVLLGAVALLLAASVLPALLGWQSSVVMSGSMEPTFSPGDVAVVRPVDVGTLEPGAVLLVDDPDLPGRLRLHRLVEVEAGGLQLKGDANPTVDQSLVDPAAVHGVVTLGLPLVGEPALWWADHHTAPLAGTAAALVVLLGLACLHRRPDDDPPAGTAGRPGPRTGRRSVRLLRRGTALSAVVLVGISFPGTGAVFSDAAPTPRFTLPVARYWTCPDAVAGAGATDYFRLQSQGVANTGNPGASSGGGYSGSGVSYGAAGPACGAGNDQAVALDGSTGQLWSTVAVTGPQTFTVQVWFATTTTSGGKLMGFGGGVGGATSNQYDRHIYMLNSGQLSFGVYDGSNRVVTTGGRYNDGGWHLATATFSPTTGMALYVDGQRLVSNTAVTQAENTTGYWRMGYDNLNGWSGAPTSYWFRGSLAHAAVFGRVLSSTEIAEQYVTGS